MKSSQPKCSTSPEKSSAAEASCNSGAEKLRDAADKVIGRDSMTIAEALSTNGKNGMVQSIKLLYELSEGSKSDKQDDAARIRSMATELATAPPWTGKLPSENHEETDEDVQA